MNVAGIDVACKSVTVVTALGEKLDKAREVVNDAAGHALLAKQLKATEVERVCLEATGSYHLDLALALDAADIPVMTVNPRAAKSFAAALLARSKTDAVDAGVLAELPAACPSSRGSARARARSSCAPAPAA